MPPLKPKMTESTVRNPEVRGQRRSGGGPTVADVARRLLVC